ncbi:MAG: hypothetical protein V2I36_12855 [Desulfopila sp.]|jgi:hypothetical protein|nr:hypothetical protein [Desulfopila sp.]
MGRKVLHSEQTRKSEIESIGFLRKKTTTKLEPFIGADSTAGMEYELQVAVEGLCKDVDLPQTILGSNYYGNIVKRANRGDLAPGSVDALNTFLYKNESNIWENSWVRIRPYLLSSWTREMLADDLLADKKNRDGGRRKDAGRYSCMHQESEMLRLPISYLLKLSLAQAVSSAISLPQEIGSLGKKLLGHLVSDNTSPEILSFTIPRADTRSIGDLAGAETARTLLLCQLLIQYANTAFRLEESGQKSLLYFAPHAPARQKHLNDLVPDGFYRHLFMSPCLSGWDRGEEKYQYMALCHKTLSRSRLNTISKLKDAGIIVNNLVVLPNTSSTCLANNGIHVSLGSAVLGELAETPEAGFTPAVEKYFGDLVIKIVEHFLPLTVGTCSAAPYRIDFQDFHPENVLGFLPHELDYTHLRMVWRRWKKKADLRFFGRSFTPFGPRWFDTLFAKTFGLRGDIVPDFRLLDYFVTLLSTESSPALNGALESHDQLKEELMDMGVFDTRMSIYLLYRQRLLATSGYCGFEGRSYSLFPSHLEDMAEAVDIQNLITALAYKYVLQEKVCHSDIPDVPSLESERRQIFFGTAIGIPTFYVRSDTGNRFLRRILDHVHTSRKSNRYRGYLRVKNTDYRLALLRVIKEDGAELLEKLQVGDRLRSLEEKILDFDRTAGGRLTAGVCRHLPSRQTPLSVSSDVFNCSAEKYYRTELKKFHIREGLEVLVQDCLRLDKNREPRLQHIGADVFGGAGAAEYVARNIETILSEKADEITLQKFIHICLAVIHDSSQRK